MNDRQTKIMALKDEYYLRLVEGKDADSLTSFDKEVLNALDKLFDAHRDVAVPPECASLGFVLKSAANFIGCKTVPCSPGCKMPFEKKSVPCALIQTMCDMSPWEMVHGGKSNLITPDNLEKNDDPS